MYFLAFDFDGTVADTFTKSPSGIGVKEAYEQAILDIFGEEGKNIYNELGRLKNRAPSELVKAILDHAQELSKREELIKRAKEFYITFKNDLTGLVPEKKGVPLQWPEPPEDSPEKIIAELLVRKKLEILSDEIGKQFPDGSLWPRPCAGFIPFWWELQSIKNECGITTAIISSGHEKFIEKVFSIYGLPLPNILVTEDDIRGRKYPQEMERRVKPGELSFALAHQQWLRRIGKEPTTYTIEDLKSQRPYEVYFGDDPNKDGEMARKAGVIFGWYNPKGESITTSSTSISFKFFGFEDWQRVAEILTEQSNALREGRPLYEIFLSQKQLIGEGGSMHPERG